MSPGKSDQAQREEAIISRMIQSPGLVRKDQIPAWLSKIQIIEMTGWTEQEYNAAPLDTIRKLFTYINGRARGERQKAQRERMRNKNR